MKYRTERRGDWIVVHVPSQLIAENRQELKQLVLDEIEAGSRRVEIDVANTGYIDSAGLGVLVSLSKTLRERGGALRMSHLNSDLRTLFKLTRLDQLFGIDEPASPAAEASPSAPSPRISGPRTATGSVEPPPEASAR
jgi:anti-sigma B factor antagonist